MEDLPVPLPHVQDPYAPQGAGVRGLAAPLGVESGAVQHDNEMLLLRLAGADRGGEGLEEGILVVEFFGLRHRQVPP